MNNNNNNYGSWQQPDSGFENRQNNQQQSFNQAPNQPQHYAQQQGFSQAPNQPQNYAQQQGFNQAPNQPQQYAQQQGFNQAPSQPQHYAQQQSFNQAPNQPGYYGHQTAAYTPYMYNYVPSPAERLNAKKNNEKRTMRKLGNRTGWSVCAMVVGMTIIFIMVFLIFDSLSASADYTTQECISSLSNSIAAMLSMFGGGFMLLALTKTRLSDVVTFKRIQSPKRCTAAFLVGLGAIPICNLIAELVASNLTLIGIENKDYGATDGTPEITVFYVLVQILCTAIVPAISEEFFFRGAILGALKPYGQGFAIIMSSVLFGLVHGNLGQIPFAIAGGIFFAFLTVYTGSMIPSMILHGLNNLLSVILDILLCVCDENVAYAVLIAYYLIFSIIAVIAFVKLSRRDKNLLRLKRPTSAISEKEKAVSFMVSPGFIAFVVFMFFETMSAYFMY